MSDQNQKIIDTISSLSGKPASEISRDLELVADLGIDSSKSLQLLVELEDTLGIEISDEEAANMESVGDVLGLCEGV